MNKNYKNWGRAVMFGLAAVLTGQTAQSQVTVQTFSYTGSIQTFTVPSCVTSISMAVRGAQGGFAGTGTGGLGALMTGVFTVTPGQIIKILVGQCPGNVSNGGFTFPGGGGGSYVANGAVVSSATPMIVAGGGGGGYNTAGDNAPTGTSGTGSSPGTNGNGAPANSCGGGGGGFYTSGGNDINYGFPGGAGFQQGGAGGWATPTYTSTYQPGGFGGGTSANYVGSCNLQGGNGGGYSGGSGYGTSLWQAGTAGGSFNAGTNQVNTAGANTGNGLVTFSYTPNVPFPAVVTPTAICNGGTATLSASGMTSYTWFPQNTAASSVTVNPSSNTAYSVVATSTSGCTGTVVITLTVSPALPSPTITSSSNTVCLGQSASLTGSGGLTYSWSNSVLNGVPFTPTVTNTYTLVTGNGCGTVSATRAITVAPLPVSIVSNPTTICSGYTSTLSATSAATSYSWFPTTQTGSTTIVSPTANIIYTLVATDGTCAGTQTLGLSVLTTPTITATSSATRICQGSVVTFSAVGAGIGGTYTWTPSNATGNVLNISPSTSTVFSVYGTNTLNCTASAQLPLIVDNAANMTISASKTMACLGQSVTLFAGGANSYSWTGGPTTSSYVINAGSGSTTYTVLGGQNTNTCVATRTIAVTAITPTVIAPASVSICPNGTATLTASGATSYNWGLGNSASGVFTVAPAATTAFTVVATTASLNAASQTVNCTASQVASVIVLSNPNVTVVPTRTAICKGETNTLTATGASTYSWSAPGTGSAIVISPTATAFYTVTGTDNNNCKSEVIVTAKVNLCSGIAEVGAKSSQISVYPNPNNGDFSIRAESNLQLLLVNSLGQVVRIIDAEAGHTVDVHAHDLSAGVYFLSGQNSGEQVNVRIIITH